VPGYGGYVTTLDSASLEPGANFSATLSGYVDTTAGAGKYLLQKASALEVYVSPTVSGNITADILGVVSSTTDTVTLAPNAAGDLTNLPTLVGAATHWEANLTNDSDTSYVANGTGVNQSDLYNITDPASTIQKYLIKQVDLYTVMRSAGGDVTSNIEWKTNATTYDYADITETGAYATYSVTLTTNNFTGVAWTWQEVIDLQVGIRAKAVVGTPRITQTYAIVTYYLPITVSATSVSSGEHDIEVGANDVKFYIYIDGVLADWEWLP